MNFKKVLILSAASVAVFSSAAVYAGGPDVSVAASPCPVCPPAFTPFAYVGASLGWAYSDWNSFILSGAPSSADTNGFTFGGKMGYQFLNHFGAEVGGFSLPKSNQTFALTPATSLSGSVNSWFIYGAATMRAALPFNPNLHIVGKVGEAYRSLTHDGSLYTNVGTGFYTTMIFGGSLEYDLAAKNLPLTVGLDYLYLPGSDDSFFTTGNSSTTINKKAAPAAQVVAATLSYKFAL